jgi:hypothetical protein
MGQPLHIKNREDKNDNNHLGTRRRNKRQSSRHCAFYGAQFGALLESKLARNRYNKIGICRNSGETLTFYIHRSRYRCAFRPFNFTALRSGFMSYLGKLLSLAAVGTMTGNSLVMSRQLLSRIIVIAALTAVSVIFVVLFVVAGLFVTYTSLVSYGLHSLPAMFVVAGLLFVMAMAAVGMTFMQIRSLHQKVRLAMTFDIPFMSKIGSLVTAFLEGLHEAQNRQAK